MKFVLYLSGQNRSRAWHSTQDTEVGSVQVPKKDQGLIEAMMQDFIEDFNPDAPFQVLPLDEVHDVFSDALGEELSYEATLKEVVELCRSEAACGILHVVS